jgi:hypothetical protein
MFFGRGESRKSERVKDRNRNLWGWVWWGSEWIWQKNGRQKIMLTILVEQHPLPVLGRWGIGSLLWRRLWRFGILNMFVIAIENPSRQCSFSSV